MSRLLTADEFLSRPACEHPQELVRGRVVDYPLAFPTHGYVCSNVSCEIGNHVEAADAGWAMLTHAVVTERNPDTVRGPDVSFYSFDRLPRGRLPDAAYLDVMPDLIAEVLSPSDRWSLVLGKVAEYLTAGVTVVLVANPPARTVTAYRDAEEPQPFAADAVLTVPDVLPGFAVPVATLFE